MSEITDKEKTVLGSGKIFAMAFAGEIPEDSVIETDGNKLGDIQGGASIEYTPSFYTVADDLGLVKETYLTSEEAKMKLGIVTWCGTTFNKLVQTARITEAEGKRTVKIGGVGNYDGTRYLWRFLHEDKKKGDVRVTIVGTNNAGFTLTFAKDKETVINPEVAALPSDDKGTLIIYEEEIPTTV